MRLISVMCGLILATLFLACAGPVAAQTTLQGSWTATKAERDGKPADDVVGHRLTFTSDRFEYPRTAGPSFIRGRSGPTRTRSQHRSTS